MANDKAKLNEIAGMIAGLEKHAADLIMRQEPEYAARLRQVLQTELNRAHDALAAFDTDAANLQTKIDATKVRIGQLRREMAGIRHAKQIAELQKLAEKMQGVSEQDIANAAAALASEQAEGGRDGA